MAVQTRLDECLSIRDGRLFIEECEAHELARRLDVVPGDTIALLDTRAYQDGLARNINALPRPGMVLVHGNQAEWIKRPETVADVFRSEEHTSELQSR